MERDGDLAGFGGVNIGIMGALRLFEPPPVGKNDLFDLTERHLFTPPISIIRTMRIKVKQKAPARHGLRMKGYSQKENNMVK